MNSAAINYAYTLTRRYALYNIPTQTVNKVILVVPKQLQFNFNFDDLFCVFNWCNFFGF